MLFPSTMVAQTDPSRLASGAAGSCAPLPVGLWRWPSGTRTTVVVKASYLYEPTLSDDVLELAGRQPALEARDFVAAKPACDVIVVGSAHAPHPSDRIACGVRIAGAAGESHVFERHWFTSAASTSAPLDDDAIVALTGGAGDPVGWVPTRTAETAAEAPRADATELDDEAKALLKQLVWPSFDDEPEAPADDDGLDWGQLEGVGPPMVETGVQQAAEAMTCAWLDPGGRLVLEGLTPRGGARTLALPRHFPVVIYEAATLRYDVPVALDTLLIDTDGIVTLTWRGQIPLDALGSVGHRLVVSLEDVDALRPLVVIYGELTRGHFYRAQTAPDQHAPAPDPDVDLRVAPLRAQAFAQRYARAIRRALASSIRPSARAEGAT